MHARAIEKPAAMLRRVAIVAAMVLTGGCAPNIGDLSPLPMDATDPDAPDAGPDGYAVRGTATGVLGPVALELRIDGDTELLSVTQDGSFAFQARLEVGASYTVELVSPDVPCTLRSATGVIADADAAVELTCTGPFLDGLVVSGIAPAVTLVPGTTDYVVDLPLLQEAVTLTAIVEAAGDTLTIAGTSVDSGVPSAPVTLSLGDNVVDIVVENALGWPRTYRLNLRRAAQLAQYAYGKASNPDVSDGLGCTVALSGDTLAIAACAEDSAAQGVGGNQADNSASDAGAVYVFRRTGAIWQQEAYLKTSNAALADYFGISLALSGDTLAVGAYGEDSAAQGVGGNQADNSASDAGAVYVFRRSGTTWQQEAYLKASNNEAGDLFGSSVALSGDTLAVGSRFEDSAATGVNGDQINDSLSESGAVYVFRRIGTIWQQEAYLKASNTGTGDHFGWSVALSGDTLAVGADSEDSAAQGVGGSQTDNSASASGAVYVFRRSGATWQQEAYLKASNTGAGDVFGWSVALSGDTLAVGAYFEDSAAQGVGGDQTDNSANNSGAIYMFRHSGTTWQQEAYLKASNTGAGDRFGVSVALSGDTLAVGANHEASAAQGVGSDQTDNSASDSGAAYVFRRTGTTWQQAEYVKASNTGAGDQFGSSVALSGDTLAVGADGEDSAAQGVGGDQTNDSAASSGAVYVFH
jgi:hypothetical protein